MAIKVEHGKVSTIAKLGKLAGESVSARRDYERRETMLHEAQQQQQQQDLAKYQMDQQAELERNRVEVNTKQQQAAMQWDMQKMAMRSQNDFEMEEMKRMAEFQQEMGRELQKKAKLSNLVDLINEKKASGELSDSQYTQAMLNAESRYAVGSNVLPSTSSSGYGVKPWEEDPAEANNPRAIAARKRAEQTENYSSTPYMLRPDVINTSIGRALQEDAGIFLDEDAGAMSIEQLEAELERLSKDITNAK